MLKYKNNRFKQVFKTNKHCNLANNSQNLTAFDSTYIVFVHNFTLKHTKCFLIIFINETMPLLLSWVPLKRTYLS